MRSIVLTIALTAVACGGSPTSPSGQPEQFTGTVNGQSFAASANGRGALRTTASTVSMVGMNCSIGASINIMLRNPTVGTFPVSPDVTIQWIPDSRTSGATQENWIAPGGGGFTSGTVGSGTVTVTSITSDWISGSFNAVVVPWFTNQDQTAKTVTGSFELSFESETIC